MIDPCSSTWFNGRGIIDGEQLNYTSSIIWACNFELGSINKKFCYLNNHLFYKKENCHKLVVRILFKKNHVKNAKENTSKKKMRLPFVKKKMRLPSTMCLVCNIFFGTMFVILYSLILRGMLATLSFEHSL